MHLNMIGGKIVNLGGGKLSNPDPANAAADWLARSTAPGVVYATDFSGSNDFVLASTNGGHVFAPNMDATQLTYVVKDTTDGLTNGCCLRLDHPASEGSGGWEWMFSFNPTWTLNSQSFGTAEYWIQHRFKIPASRLVIVNFGSNGHPSGWKWLNLAQYSPTNTVAQSFSNTLAEIVGQDLQQLGFPQAYHRDPSASFPPFQGFSGGQITLQPSIDRGSSFSGGNRYCWYPNGSPACEFWITDQWCTLMYHIQDIDFTGGPGNVFDLYFAGPGESTWTQIVGARDFALGDPNSSGGGFTGRCGGHFSTFDTNRVNSTVDTWQKYDQLIVSTQQIAIPMDSGSP